VGVGGATEPPAVDTIDRVHGEIERFVHGE
jgi:hypothetical protein